MNLTKIAQSVTTLSPIMNGEKLETDQLVKVSAKTPLHITKVDIVTMSKGERFAVCSFAEYPNAFYCGGLILTKIVDTWLNACGGEIDSVNAEIEKKNPAITLEKERSKDGMSYTKINIIADGGNNIC